MNHRRLYSAVLALSLACLAPQQASAQSFLAPDPAAETKDIMKGAAPGAPAGSLGLLAPPPESAPDSAGIPAAPDRSGLLQGNSRIPSPAATSPLSYSAPGLTPGAVVLPGIDMTLPSKKLKDAARKNRPKKEITGKPVSPELIALLSKKMIGENGKTVLENDTASKISRIMTELENPKLSEEQRKKKASDYYSELLNDQDTMIARGKLSQGYRIFGLSEETIAQRMKGNQNALDMTQKTLKTLKDMKE